MGRTEKIIIPNQWLIERAQVKKSATSQMKHTREIKDTLEKLYSLLMLDDNSPWAESVIRWHNEIEYCPNETIRGMIHSSGGPGSFGDFPLYKNSEVLYKEMVELSALRDRLFYLCVESLPEVSKNSDRPESDDKNLPENK